MTFINLTHTLRYCANFVPIVFVFCVLTPNKGNVFVHLFIDLFAL